MPSKISPARQMLNAIEKPRKALRMPGDLDSFNIRASSLSSSTPKTSSILVGINSANRIINVALRQPPTCNT